MSGAEAVALDGATAGSQPDGRAPGALAPRATAAARGDGNELDRLLARGGMALELAARLAAVGLAARSCAGAACERVAGMMPVAGPVSRAVASEDDRGLAALLAAVEVTSFALVALGVCDAWSERRGRVRVGLRGPGLIVAGEH